MRIVHTLIPALGLLAACASNHVVRTPAPVNPGDTVRYAFHSDQSDFVQARAISLTADTLVFERSLIGEPGRWVKGQFPTDSLARLQVHVGRHGNAAKGVVIGAAIGLGFGALCATEPDTGYFSTGDCVLTSTLTGASLGLLFGALKHTNEWAPVVMPEQVPAAAPGPAVSVVPAGVGIRIPFRAGGP